MTITAFENAQEAKYQQGLAMDEAAAEFEPVGDFDSKSMANLWAASDTLFSEGKLDKHQRCLQDDIDLLRESFRGAIAEGRNADAWQCVLDCSLMVTENEYIDEQAKQFEAQCERDREEARAAA